MSEKSEILYSDFSVILEMDTLKSKNSRWMTFILREGFFTFWAIVLTTWVITITKEL